MKLLDRMTGQQVCASKLPKQICSGRYLLTQKTLINGHTWLEPGSVVMGDGSGRIKLDDYQCLCNEVIDEEDQETTYTLISQALSQIDQTIDFKSGNYPSPLIPSQLLDDKGKLDDCEILLEKVLGKGHLHEISRNPRFNMRYDDMVLPVSRAKRLANTAQRHLASHSECWQQRTFTGIHPRKILGLVSEDEYNLYENRLYARLNDELVQHLSKRLREVNELISELTKALSLEDSEDLIYLLRLKLCENWGETFSDKDTLGYIDLLNETKKRLEDLQRGVRGFTQGFLYKRIPRTAHISGQIEQTNILCHDQHYRHLPPLWHELKNVTQNDSLTQEELLEKNQRLQIAFSNYTGMIVIRALKQLGFQTDYCSCKKTRLSYDVRKVTVIESEMNWTVQDEFSGYKLILVPVFSWNMTDDCRVQSTAHSLVIPISINSKNKAEHPVDYIIGNFQEHLSISPLDFYSEEYFVSMINYGLLTKPINIYGAEIKKIPSSSMPLLNKSNAFEVITEHSVRMIRPPDLQELDEIIKSLYKENANSSIVIISDSLIAIKTLSRCPTCQNDAIFYERDRQSFKAICTNNDCKLEWGISYKNEKRIFGMLLRDQKNPLFANSGRWFCRVPLDAVKFT